MSISLKNAAAIIIGLGSFLYLTQASEGATFNLFMRCGPFATLNETANSQGCGDYCFAFKVAQRYFDALTHNFGILNVQGYIQDFSSLAASLDLNSCGKEIYRLQCR